jgi:hypothetical protein
MRLVTFKRAGRLEQRAGALREDGASWTSPPPTRCWKAASWR